MKSLALSVVILAGWVVAPWADDAKICVAMSWSASSYPEFVAGFQEGSSFSYEYIVVEQPDALLAQDYRLVVAIGPEAIAASRTLAPMVPVVYSMVLDPKNLPRNKATGIGLFVSLEDQLRVIRRLFPGRTRLGVVYHPVYSSGLIQEARRLAPPHGLQIMPIAVESKPEISDALSKFTHKTVDFVWMLPDPLTADAVAIQKQIIHAKMSGLPAIGLSIHHVKTGAFMAISADTRDLGVQTAQAVQRVLDGRAGGRLDPPRKTLVYVNAYLQQTMSIPVPEEDDVRWVETPRY